MRLRSKPNHASKRHYNWILQYLPNFIKAWDVHIFSSLRVSELAAKFVSFQSQKTARDYRANNKVKQKGADSCSPSFSIPVSMVYWYSVMQYACDACLRLVLLQFSFCHKPPCRSCDIDRQDYKYNKSINNERRGLPDNASAEQTKSCAAMVGNSWPHKWCSGMASGVFLYCLSKKH